VSSGILRDVTKDRTHAGAGYVRRRLAPSVLVVSSLCLAVGAALLFHFRVHLFWQFQANRLGLRNIPSVPNRPMPHIPVPDTWVRCRVGTLEFSLPTDLASNPDRLNNGSICTFYHGWQAVVVSGPIDVEEYSQFCETASLLCPESERFTIPRLRLVCSQASSDDFRWSMTPDQVRWHAYCMITRNLIGIPSEGRTEAFFGNDMQGIVHFTHQGATFFWQSITAKRWGYMKFRQRRESPEEDWIRAVCQSVRLSPPAEPQPSNCHSKPGHSRSIQDHTAQPR